MVHWLQKNKKEWSIMAFLALILVSGGIVVVGCLDERRRRG